LISATGDVNIIVIMILALPGHISINKEGWVEKWL
jgi:hypothetical protein